MSRVDCMRANLRQYRGLRENDVIRFTFRKTRTEVERCVACVLAPAS